MEWGRAKKFVMILLVILNGVLAVLNYRQHQENTMTAAQERAIFEVLSQNGISMYTELPKEVAARPRISAKTQEYSKETLERLFFRGEKTVVTVRGDQMIYRGENASLTMNGIHGLWVQDDAEEEKEKITKQAAEQIAQRFMDGTEHFFGTYGTPRVTELETGFQVDFYGQYKQEQIFANYFSITVADSGIRQIHFSYAPIEGYSGEKRDLCYPDEALLTFMRERKKEGAAQEAAVQHMELGYDRMEKNTAAGEGAIYLEPCYRIYVMDEDEPYLVNAYTCQIVHKD